RRPDQASRRSAADTEVQCCPVPLPSPLLLRRRHLDGIEDADVIDIGLVRISVDPRFDLVTEMCDQALDRPSRGVAERANGMAFDLLGDLQEHVDLTLKGAALGHTGQYPPHPSRSLA